MTLRAIHLHGSLKKEFGPKFDFDVRTAAEALRALNCAFPGKFVAALQGKKFALVRGPKTTGMRLDIDLINEFGLGGADLHIMPVATGASAAGKGTTKVVLGSVLIGAAIFASGGTLAAPLLGGIAPGVGVTWGSIASIGAGLALAGASTLLAKPAPGERDTTKDTSHTINGATNNGEQGDAIPLVYGREVIVGSVTVSFDADIEDIGAYS